MLQVLFFSRGRYKNLWTITCAAFLLLQDAIRGCWALSKMWVHCDRCVWKVNWAGICWNWTYTTRYFLSKNSKGTQGPLPCFWMLLFLSSIRPQVFGDVWCGPTINKSFSFPIQKSDGSNERIFWNLSVKETLFHISFRWLRALVIFHYVRKTCKPIYCWIEMKCGEVVKYIWTRYCCFWVLKMIGCNYIVISWPRSPIFFQPNYFPINL